MTLLFITIIIQTAYSAFKLLMLKSVH